MRKKPIPAWLPVLLFIAGQHMAWAQSEDVAVVVNAGNPASAITLSDLRKTFSREKRSWPGGIPVKLIVRTPGCHERLVLLRLLKMSEGDYQQYWTAQVLRGEATSPPVAVPSVGMQKEAIMTFLGAITLVDEKDVKPGMKVIKVDGHLPGESGYSLR